MAVPNAPDAMQPYVRIAGYVSANVGSRDRLAVGQQRVQERGG
jgi:hypothetical protein